MYVRRVKSLPGAVKKPPGHSVPAAPSRTSAPLSPGHRTVDTRAWRGYLLADMRTLFLYVNRCGEAVATLSAMETLLATHILGGEQRSDPRDLHRYPRQRLCDPSCRGQSSRSPQRSPPAG
jgi:hypothetical protein